MIDDVGKFSESAQNMQAGDYSVETIPECQEDTADSIVSSETQQFVDQFNDDEVVNEQASNEQELGIEDAIERLATLEQQVQTLTELFKEKITRTNLERDTAKRLSDEIQEYRQDLFAKFTHPILRQIIAEREDFAAVVNQASNNGKDSVSLNIVESFGDSMDEILLDNGVQIIVPEIGQKPTATLHRIVGKIPTSNQALHKTIADYACCAYKIGDKVLTMSKVRIYAFDPSLVQSEDESIVDEQINVATN